MLARFDKEHTHDEDEVRFILAGRGIFFLHLDERVVSVEVGPGDMLRVPRGTTHWFTLCEDRRIRAIRWFQQTLRLDTALHRLGRGQGLPAAVLRAGVPRSARSDQRSISTHERMSAERPKLYLLDVEGTVAPLSLVDGAAVSLCARALCRIPARETGMTRRFAHDLVAAC